MREAIHNALRHSGARLVTVRVSWAPDAVAVTVSDDGHGFRHADVRSGALGLITAQERAELIGADLRIDPGAGRGTSVVLTVPNLGAAG